MSWLLSGLIILPLLTEPRMAADSSWSLHSITIPSKINLAIARPNFLNNKKNVITYKWNKKDGDKQWTAEHMRCIQRWRKMCKHKSSKIPNCELALRFKFQDVCITVTEISSRMHKSKLIFRGENRTTNAWICCITSSKKYHVSGPT